MGSKWLKLESGASVICHIHKLASHSAAFKNQKCPGQNRFLHCLDSGNWNARLYEALMKLKVWYNFFLRPNQRQACARLMVLVVVFALSKPNIWITLQHARLHAAPARGFSHRAACYVMSCSSCTLAWCIRLCASECESVHMFDRSGKLVRYLRVARLHKMRQNNCFQQHLVWLEFICQLLIWDTLILLQSQAGWDTCHFNFLDKLP